MIAYTTYIVTVESKYGMPYLFATTFWPAAQSFLRMQGNVRGRCVSIKRTTKYLEVYP